MQHISAGIYFDAEGNVIIDPVIRAPAGFGIASCKFIKLQNGYTKEELAESIMKALEISTINEQEEDRNFWTEATGIKGYAAFSRKHKSISIDYILEKEGYRVTAEKRYKDGSYGIERDDVPLRVKEYPGKPSVETIADYVLEALKIE